MHNLDYLVGTAPGTETNHYIMTRNDKTFCGIEADWWSKGYAATGLNYCHGCEILMSMMRLYDQ